MRLKDTFPAFLRCWLQWVEDGTPYHEVFKTDQGLCDNFCDWVYRSRRELCGEYINRRSVYDFMGRLFEADGLHRSFPFHADAHEFDAELEEYGCAYSDKRVQWAKDYLNKLVDNNPEWKAKSNA